MVSRKIAIFASGTGSNAKNILTHVKDNAALEIAFILSNVADAPVLDLAKDAGIKPLVLSNKEAENSAVLLEICRSSQVDFIVLAGYLRKIPAELVLAYPNRIINVHPSLLPKFGGKGMYGKHVHKAVLAAKETEAGITIHFVNEEFDKGQIIAQFRYSIAPTDQLSDLLRKTQLLEKNYLPWVVEKTVLNEMYV